jgi:TatD DNase family protein
LNLDIVDTHAHLDMPEFETDLDEVVTRAAENGVKTIITIGINPASNLRALRLTEKYSGVYAGIGIHPQDSRGIQESDFKLMIEQSNHQRVVAIGELGLDFHREHSSREEQLRVLDWQLAAARQIGKPIVIHCRNAQETLIPILKDWVKTIPDQLANNTGILHNFRDDIVIANQYLDMGFYIALGAYLGYPSSSALRETVKEIPNHRLVLETDCPFLPPQKRRGGRNEPAYTLYTLEVMAQIKGLSLEAMAEITTTNARTVFGLEQFTKSPKP